MSWRTVVIKNPCKLSYKGGFMVVRGDTLTTVHLEEINTLIIDSLEVSITSFLVSELMKCKVKIIFCNDKHNPNAEVHSIFGHHHSSKRIKEQMEWDNEIKERLWQQIIRKKIENQATLLEYYHRPRHQDLVQYQQEVELGDHTNREGHAAKVYFEHLFDEFYGRENDDDINAALNYGYSILLSNFNKEIVALGLLTQLGIKHHNEFNFYNLSCDLIEIFRVVVDRYVKENEHRVFNQEYKLDLINLINHKVYVNDDEQYVSNAIALYVHSVYQALSNNDLSLLLDIKL